MSVMCLASSDTALRPLAIVSSHIYCVLCIGERQGVALGGYFSQKN